MSKLAKYLIVILGVAIAVLIMWRFSSIVGYILISAVLTIVGKPLVDAIQCIHIKKNRIPKWIAALITVAAMWAIAILFFTFFFPLVFSKLSELSTLDIPYIINSFREPLQSLQEWIVRTFAVKDPTFSITDQIANALTTDLNLTNLNSILTSTVSIVISTAIALFSITFITFFFLKESNLFQNMIVSLFPQKYEANIIHAIESTTSLLIRYFTGILAESGILFILLSGAFMLWGFNMETAFFMGFIVGIMNVIPYIGPIISAFICIIVGMISPMAGYAPMEMAFIIVGMILLIQGIDNFVLQPYLYSNRVKAHPLEIFIVILIAGSLGGVVGMLLAIPAYTVVRVFAKEFFNNYRVVQELTKKMD